MPKAAMEAAMQARPTTKTQAIAVPANWASTIKVPLLVLTLAPLLACVAVIGAVRLLQSVNDGTISIWRLMLLFAHVCACVMVVSALYNRGRTASRSPRMPRGRA
jgi:hypothetical protein